MAGKSRQSVKEQFVVDSEGRRVPVILDIEVYQKLYEALEELDIIRAYDEAKRAQDEAIPFEQAVREIEQERG